MTTNPQENKPSGIFTRLRTYRENNKTWADVVCSCGKEKKLADHWLKRVNNECNSCADYNKDLYKGREYTSWDSMKNRCNSPNNSRWREYGGRGIGYDQRWEFFSNFYNDMGDAPPGTTLDRVDVNGDYCKDNCRWVDQSTQSFNQRKRKTNTSGRTGVDYIKSKKRWRAAITYLYKNYHLGYFKTFEEAVLARENAELHYYGFIKE